MNDNQERIVEIIQAIEEKKQEIVDAEYIIKFNPRMINELERELFELIEKKMGINDDFV